MLQEVMPYSQSSYETTLHLQMAEGGKRENVLKCQSLQCKLTTPHLQMVEQG